VYIKNWSSYHDYGKVNNVDPEWMLTHQKMKLTPNAKFMHCLPVRRNVIVEDAVIDSASSIVIPQAANREIAAQTVLEQILVNL
jgi:N-succinyl-L-ornithine transcarbamylase